MAKELFFYDKSIASTVFSHTVWNLVWCMEIKCRLLNFLLGVLLFDAYQSNTISDNLISFVYCK